MQEKVKRAKNLLIELEALQQADGISNSLIILNELLRDAKGLAEEVIKEKEQSAKELGNVAC